MLFFTTVSVTDTLLDYKISIYVLLITLDIYVGTYACEHHKREITLGYPQRHNVGG